MWIKKRVLMAGGEACGASLGQARSSGKKEGLSSPQSFAHSALLSASKPKEEGFYLQLETLTHLYWQ